MRVSLRYGIIGAAALVICLIMVFAVGRHGSAKGTSEVSAAEAQPVAVAILKHGSLSNSFSVAGEFLPFQEVELHAKVAGYIRKITVDIGDRVKAGEVLATLEVPELNAQVTGADAGVNHSRQEILRAQSEVARAQAEHTSLHAAAQRLQQVSDTQPGLIAQQELDNALAKDRSSEAQVDASKSALAAAEQRLAGSQATKEQVSAMQEYSRIVAPFDGVVTWRYADTGALIQAGTSNNNSLPVVKVAEINTLRLRVPVPESLAGQVRIGTEVEVRVQATGERFGGKVSRLTDSFDRSTRTMQVEVDVPNRGGKLSPGMYADVSLQTATRKDALVIPIQALNRENDKTTVLLVNPQNRVEVRQVKIGLEEPNQAEVLAGLTAGDRVILGTFSAYQPGQVVAPKVRDSQAEGR